MLTFTYDHSPAEVVKLFPRASDLFKSHKIDFCCGGDTPLRDVFIKRESLDGDEILRIINDAYKQWKENGNAVVDWDSISNTQLIDHIMEHHHYLDEELPALGQFVTKIFRVHGNQHPHLKELYSVYNELKAELESHIIEEENELFPLIKEYEIAQTPTTFAKIQELNKDMEKEHVAAGELLSQINNLTNGFEPPIDACNSYRITYARLKELESNTFQHIHLENNILFKKFVS
ncbi:iron-sulfur cluster repair di-iron protein [Aquibacillus koreensis]|uniref:Iron-sulfur cluster repair di-iron protein n=1 Tax=Aquibacillus koreensis TaxID=279446 RepID=A0A9X3WIL7_9BACI|nr:iron-sulfur cluster repair di-iron protein [Aquibacillus koreensis]MCT2534336.1 iron-sulfur cluster repair di-iron protein [Aquibacillus koreensis]MDC3420657.1 iron-sulfur cluster repair di-iron protein [Aquibacillus koreensis]